MLAAKLQCYSSISRPRQTVPEPAGTRVRHRSDMGAAMFPRSWHAVSACTPGQSGPERARLPSRARAPAITRAAAESAPHHQPKHQRGPGPEVLWRQAPLLPAEQAIPAQSPCQDRGRGAASGVPAPAARGPTPRPARGQPECAPGPDRPTKAKVAWARYCASYGLASPPPAVSDAHPREPPFPQAPSIAPEALTQFPRPCPDPVSRHQGPAGRLSGGPAGLGAARRSR